MDSFKVKTMWHCDACDKTIQRSSKSAHLKSKNHQKNTGNTECTKECDLCCTPSSLEFKHCTQCVNSWCVECNKKIDKCPFCRTRIIGAPPRPVQWELGPEFLPEPLFEVNYRRPTEIEVMTEFHRFMERMRRLQRSMTQHVSWMNSVIHDDWY